MIGATFKPRKEMPYRFKKTCKRCTNIFRPTSKHGRICDKCRLQPGGMMDFARAYVGVFVLTLYLIWWFSI
jgi:hypothetical protein